MSDLFETSEYPDYLKPLPARLVKKYAFVRGIKPGRNGMAYIIQSKIDGRPYVLKTISPVLQDKQERERVRTTLEKEVTILKPLNHRCLPTIYEHDVTTALPYYVSTFHPGQTWESFRLSGQQLRLDEAFFVIASLIDVLEYIHSEGRTHCDLHGDNILLSPKVFAEGLIVIDFGSGHRESDENPETHDRGNANFKNIRGQKQHRKTVNRKQSSSEFRAYDFAALGKALNGMEEAFCAFAPYDQRLAYSDFCRMLQDGSAKTWQDVRERFEHVVDPEAFLTRNEHLFVMPDGNRPRIIIPASSPIPVGEGVLSIINCLSFQRLRAIRQLSFCEWQFPGGTHARFEHSLGVFNSTRRALQVLGRNSVVQQEFKQRTFTATLLAGLVHDIGHYPFAHAIEHYAEAHFHGDHDVKSNIHHFHQTLQLLERDESLRREIEKSWGADIVEETKLVLEGKRGVLSSLLDGAVDCDKIDYLKRDSLHCGVPYGNGFELREVLAALTCSNDGERLLIKDTQVHAIEGFMTVQDQMLSAVYWHPRVRAVFAMFHAFLAGLVGEDRAKFLELVRDLKNCRSDFDALHAVLVKRQEAQPIQGTTKQASRSELKGLIQMHLEPNFSNIYLPLAKYSSLDRIDRRTESPRNVFGSIVSDPSSNTGTVPIDWKMVRRLRSAYRRSFEERNAKPGRFDILVDVPWGKNQSRALTVVDEGTGEERPISEVWHLAPTIFNRPTAYSAPIRVFIEPKLYQQKERDLGSIREAALEKFFDRAPIRDEADFA